MKRCLLIIFLFCALSSLKAQSHSFGLTLGGMYYTGDLNKVHFKFLKPAGGLVYRYNMFNRRLVFRIHGILGEIEASDAKAKSDFQNNRNLSFKSRMIEVAGLIEINFMPYRIGNTKSEFFTPYLFFGLAYLNYEPKAQLNGEWYELRNVGTEGQMSNGGKSYLGSTVAFPVGFGLKYNFSGAWAVNLEFGARVAMTDYLDDVSKTYADPSVFTAEGNILAQNLADRSLNGTTPGMSRGDQFDKDWYYYLGINLCYRIGGPISKCNERFKRKR